jgi:flavodoxin
MERRTFLGMSLAGAGMLAASNKANALKYYPKASDKKWALLYASWCGSSRDAAVWISEGMGGIADVFDVRENPDLRQYDHVVVGSSIRMAKISPEIKLYLEANRSLLKSKIRGLFAVCGNLQQPPTQATVKLHITDQLEPLTGATGVPAHVFLGRVTPILLEPDLRKLLKSAGEYDNLKRFECMAFGKEVFDKA